MAAVLIFVLLIFIFAFSPAFSLDSGVPPHQYLIDLIGVFGELKIPAFPLQSARCVRLRFFRSEA
jgi:hypothetical protein